MRRSVAAGDEIIDADDRAPPPSDPPPDPAAVLRKQAARQTILTELGLRALGKVDLQTLLDEAVQRIRESLDVDTCNVLELQPGGQAFMTRADAGWGWRLTGTHTVDAGKQSQAGYTLLSSEPVVVDDVTTERRFRVAPFLIQQGIQSGMTVLIHGRDRPYGVFGVQSKRLRKFTKEDVDYFQAAANVLGSAIERIRAEEELSRSELSFRSLIEHAPEGVLISHDRALIYVNRVLVASLGYERADELLGKSALELVHPEDRGLVTGRLDTMDVSGSPAPPREMRFLRKDGSSLLAESIGVPIVFDGKLAIAAMIRDIGERKKMESQLAQNDRLASLGTLAAGVAHEINNPLAYVLGNLDFIQAGVAEAQKDASTLRQREDAEARALGERLESRLLDLAGMVENAREGGDRVRRIVADLKVFSRGESDHPPAAIDVRRVMDSSINIARNEIRHRAQLVLEYRDVPAVMASDSRLGQVFLNLLLNAAQAIPDGAAHKNRITVRTFPTPEGRVAIEVEDTGTGIPRDIQGKLFDPFFTTKKAGVGTGLGLAICHNIVTSHGGDIAVESEPGKGSCFRVTLPAVKGAQASEPVSRPLVGPSPRGKVLIIDDEPFVAAVCQRMLAGEHDVEIATEAASALSRIESGNEFDVILCDLMMPEMSGMELYAILQSRFEKLVPRVVFLSGGAFSTGARAFRERVPNVFLDKPCAPDVLRRTVRDRVRALRPSATQGESA
jgi:PAS domain S-box-containing protein